MTDQNFTAMRRAMVESQLRTNDVNDPALLEVILAVPREAFLPEARRASAYIDRSVPLGEGRALLGDRRMVAARLRFDLSAGEDGAKLSDVLRRRSAASADDPRTLFHKTSRRFREVLG